MVKVKSVIAAVSLIAFASGASASPIGSIEWTGQGLVTPTLSLSIGGAPGRGTLPPLSNPSSILTPLDFNHTRFTLAYATMVRGGDRVPSRFLDDPATLLVSSVAVPSQESFHEPSGWTMLLIGLGIAALGSIRLRR
jgi:hypothetical protein